MTEHIETITEARHSIKISRGTRGDYGWEIKIYYESVDDSMLVIERLKNIDIDLRNRFGVPQ